MLGRRDPDFIRALEMAVSFYRHLSDGEKPLRIEEQKEQTKAIRKAAARLSSSLDGLGEVWRNGILVDADLWRLPQDLDRLMSWCDAKHKQQFRKGKPIDWDLRSLDLAVAHCLHDAGVRVTKGPDGKFARCFAVVRDAAGAPVPERDMSRAIRQAANALVQSLRAEARSAKLVAWAVARRSRRPVT